jgi:hypothetical protein
MSKPSYGPVLSREQIIALATAGDENSRFEASRWAHINSGEAAMALFDDVHLALAKAKGQSHD